VDGEKRVAARTTELNQMIDASHHFRAHARDVRGLLNPSSEKIPALGMVAWDQERNRGYKGATPYLTPQPKKIRILIDIRREGAEIGRSLFLKPSVFQSRAFSIISVSSKTFTV
jgi:hypothetical protein